jgi:hypothetical protein
MTNFRAYLDETGVSSSKRRLLASLLAKEGIDLSHEISRRESSVAPPLSFAQQRLWFIDQLEPGNPAYNITGVVKLESRLDVEALERSINEVVRRHESLRTRFAVKDGEPVQVIDEWEPRRLEVTDLTDLPAAEREDQAQRIMSEEAGTRFDLKRGQLLRVRVLKLGEGENLLLYTMHHIVSDGWSMGILSREVRALYQAYSRGEESPLEELPIQYADFAVWQRGWLKGETLERGLEYWRKQLAGIEDLELPADHPRPALRSYRGSEYRFVVERELTEKLKALSQREGATLFMVLLGGFDLLMSRYSGQTDVALGTDIANRNRAEIEGVIGFFVNQLVMRVEVRPGESFSELLKRVREVCLGAYAHQDVPFEKLVEELQPERDLSRSPLFQAKLILQNVPGEGESQTEPDDGGGDEQTMSAAQTAKFDLTVSIAGEASDLEGTAEYSRDLFEAGTIERLMTSYLTVLRGIADDSRRPVSGLSLLSETERAQILVEWNATRAEYQKNRQSKRPM